MKKSKGLTIGIVTGLLVGSFSVANAEHSRPNKGTFGGTFLSTRMDLNDDGVLAAWSTAEVNGTLGKRTTQGIADAVPTGPTPECPGGESVIDALNGVGFSAITATFPNGDQIYSRILTRTQCSLGGGKFTAADVQEILGGTGKFEGASGTVEVHSINICQAFDPNATPPQCFGSFTGEFTGTIILP